MTEVPTLEAYRTSSGGLEAWCPPCATFHHHGSGTGHRVAHCTYPNGPYRATGYVLQPVGEYSDAVRKLRVGLARTGRVCAGCRQPLGKGGTRCRGCGAYTHVTPGCRNRHTGCGPS